MASSDGGVPGGPNGGDERKTGHPDGTNRGYGPRVYDADGAVVTFRSVVNTTYIERHKLTCLLMREHLQKERKKQCAPNLQQDWRIRHKRYQTEASRPRIWVRV